MAGKDDPLAYGHFPGKKDEESERGFGDGSRGMLGDAFRMFRDKYDKYSSSSSQQGQQGQQQNPPQGYPVCCGLILQITITESSQAN